jgi:hypothetical protein
MFLFCFLGMWCPLWPILWELHREEIKRGTLWPLWLQGWKRKYREATIPIRKWSSLKSSGGMGKVWITLRPLSRAGREISWGVDFEGKQAKHQSRLILSLLNSSSYWCIYCLYVFVFIFVLTSPYLRHNLTLTLNAKPRPNPGT